MNRPETDLPRDASIFEHLRGRMHGDVFVAAHGHAGDWSVLVARCLDTHDVALVMQCSHASGFVATQRDLTRRSPTGSTLLFDLSLMRQIVVDPLQQIVRAESGATADAINRAAAASGFVVSPTLLAVEVIMPNGATVTANGGHVRRHVVPYSLGNDGGIVTALTYRLQPITD